MTRIDLSALRTLAEAASPGPWAIEPHPYGNSPARSIHVADRDADEFPVVSQLGCGCCDVGLDADAEDLAYIAALNPATVLRLLDALEAVLAACDDPYSDPCGDYWFYGYEAALEDIRETITAALEAS